MNAGPSRRQVLTIGAVGAGALLTGAAIAIATQGPWSRPSAGEPAAPDTPGTPDSSTPPAGSDGWAQPEVRHSRDGVLDLDLRVAAADVTVAGATVRMLTYNGTVPGPTLHVRPGDVLRVRLQNDLTVPTNLHTHGLHVSAEGASDNPFVDIAPGESHSYEIQVPADHPHGVNWYHPHRHGTVADQIFGGLYGALVVDADDWSEGAPRVVVVSDTTVANGAVAAVSNAERMAGRTGTTLLTNGQPAPALLGPAGSEQRLLIINACASRYLDLDFTGLDATRRGVDSLAATPPSPTTRELLTPGNRLDVTVRVPGAAGELRALPVDRGQVGMGMGRQNTATAPETVLRLVPDQAVAAPAVAAARLTEWPDLREREPARRRTLTFTMGMGGGAGMRFLIDGREYDHHRVDQQVELGTVEEWTIVNDSSMAHPFHLHIWPMQVVATDAGSVEGLEVRDVVHVPQFGSVTVRIAFERFPGRTVYHCHILDHEDLGMMGIVEAA